MYKRKIAGCVLGDTAVAGAAAAARSALRFLPSVLGEPKPESETISDFFVLTFLTLADAMVLEHCAAR